MSGSSLQDQLLKLGLAKKKPTAKRRAPTAKSGRARRPEHASGAQNMSLAQAYSERQRVEQREKTEAARRKREHEQRRREANAKLAALVPPNARNEAEAEEARYFEYGGKIRKLFVTAGQQRELNQGKLGIVGFRGRYYILDAPLIDEVRRIKPEALAFFAPDLAGDEDHE